MQYRLSHHLTSLYFTILCHLSSIHTKPHHIKFTLPTPNYIASLLLLSITLHYLTLITLSHPHHITSLYFTPPHTTKYQITSSHAISHHFTSPLSISCSLHLVTPSYFTPHYFESNHHTRSRDSLLIITVLL